MVIIYATNPIYAILGGKLFFGESIPPKIYWAYPLAFIGILILMAERLQLGFSLFGNIMALVSAIFHAAYFLSSKKARQTQNNLSLSTQLYLVAGSGFFLLSYFYQSQLLTGNPKSILAVALLILFPTFLGHFLMTYLMNFIPIAKLSFSKLLEPGMSTLAAYFVLGETVTANSFFAFSLTLFAVAITLTSKTALR
jgi:drug/metabolite transporter (DMT)-like permease